MPLENVICKGTIAWFETFITVRAIMIHQSPKESNMTILLDRTLLGLPPPSAFFYSGIRVVGLYHFDISTPRDWFGFCGCRVPHPL
jgi:hypothetical protein